MIFIFILVGIFSFTFILILLRAKKVNVEYEKSYQGNNYQVVVKEEKGLFYLYSGKKVYTNYVYGRDEQIGSSYPKLKRFIFKDKKKAEKIAFYLNSGFLYKRNKEFNEFSVLDASGKPNWYKNVGGYLEPQLNLEFGFSDFWDSWDDADAI